MVGVRQFGIHSSKVQALVKVKGVLLDYMT